MTIVSDDVLSGTEAHRLLVGLLTAIEAGGLPLAVDSETAARMLSISVKTLHRIPAIKSVKLGHRLRRYSVKALVDYLESRAA